MSMSYGDYRRLPDGTVTDVRPRRRRHHARCRALPDGGPGSVCTCVLLTVGGVR
jgi:hypothetical protein